MNLETQKAYWEAARKYHFAVADYRQGNSGNFDLHMMYANHEPCVENYRRLARTCAAKEAALQAEINALRRLRSAAMEAAQE